MTNRKIITVLAIIIMFLDFPIMLTNAQLSQPHNADAMWIEPLSTTFNNTTASVGTRFNITVWLNMTEDIFAYQVGLRYNRTQLMCTRAGYTAGGTSVYFQGHLTTSPPPVIDSGALGNGSVLASESLLDDDVLSGPHSGSLIWAEFSILMVPASGNLTSLFDIVSTYPAKTWVLDPNLNNIALTPYDASYTFTGPQAPPPLSASISSSTASIYLGQSVLFTGAVNGGTPPYSLQWFENSSLVPGANQSTWTFIPGASATYAVYLNVTDSSATTVESNTLFITVLPPLTGAEIYVDPSQIIDLSMGPGSIISINITVANVASLGGCSFNLTYDPTVLNWIGFDFLPAGGEYPTAIITGNTSAGFTWMFLNYSNPITALSAPLTSLRFYVNSYGISLLSLTDTQLLDQNGNPMTHNEFGGIFANIIRDVAVTNVVPALNWVYQTWTDNINVTVANLGNVTESFNVTAWYNSTAIGTVPIVNLGSNAQETVTIPWNTTGVASGNYTIMGTASFVPFETYFNITNNVYVDGIVQVLMIIHDVAITNITPAVTWAYVNSTVAINVTASNLGNATETFNVTAYEDGNTIGMIPIPSLAAGTNTTLTFNWNTSGITVEGNYTLSAFASYVPYEYNTANNYLTQGQVLILTQIRDVAITSVVALAYYNGSITPRPWVYQGQPMNVTVTASNDGQITESFYVTAYYNANLLGNVSVIGLAPGAAINETFLLNTTYLTLYYNYTISAQASPVPYEFNLTNNVLIDGNVTVRLLGDVNGDGVVDGKDISIIGQAFGSYGPNYLYPGSPPSSNWNPNCDLNGDDTVDGRDMTLATRNFGE
jgi:hypothetical protein